MRDQNKDEILKLAYFAGIIDNKGSVSIGLDNHKGKQYYYEQFRVTGEIEFLTKLKNEFGGSICPNGQNCKIIWRVTSDKALEMFKKIRPFAIRRTNQIDHCIKFGDIRREIAASLGKPSHSDKKKQLIESAILARNNMKTVEEASNVSILDESIRIAYNTGATEAFFGKAA